MLKILTRFLVYICEINELTRTYESVGLEIRLCVESLNKPELMYIRFTNSTTALGFPLSDLAFKFQ